MFDRFTERARQVVVFAQEEARALRHSHIGSEALLLGLLREQDGVAAQALESLGVSLEKARLAVTRYVASGDEPVEGFIPFTPRAKQILHQASDEAAVLNHKYVGTEHILLALTTIEEGVGDEHPARLRPRRDDIRDRVIQQVVGFTPSSPPRRRVRERDGDALVVPRPGPSTDPFHGFDVRPNDEVTGVLIGAAARALEDGRTETTIGDLLITLSRVERLRPVLPELTGGEARIRAALAAPRTRRPPESANGA